jgi:predicted ferric reductase
LIRVLLSMIVKLAVLPALGPSAVAALIFEMFLTATFEYRSASTRSQAGPSLRRVRHAIYPNERNANFGSNPPWWDRLAGTYHAQPGEGHEGWPLKKITGLGYRPVPFIRAAKTQGGHPMRSSGEEQIPKEGRTRTPARKVALRKEIPAVLLIVYLIIVLMPLALSYLQDLPRRGFSDEFSSALAMLAFAMLLIEFVISGRFNSVSGATGIDLTMRFHQLIARSLTVFILIHPFLYVTPLNFPLPWDVTGQLTLGLDTASIVTGILGWILLAPLVVFSVFRDRLPYSYETWRLSHGLGAALIAILGTHHAVEAGRYSGHPYLTAYWFGLLGLAIFTLLYVYVFTPLRQLRHPYRVSSVTKVALKTWSLVIEPKAGAAMDFEAGQFCWLTLDRSPFSVTEHPFSISSCPADRPSIEFTIKEVGDFTNDIGSVRVGARAYVDGPHGNLTLAGRSGAGIVLIAGGVGIAPIISILRQLRADNDARPIKLIYGNRVFEQILYESELEDLSGVLDFEIHHVLSDPPSEWTGPKGQLDQTVLRQLLSFGGHESWLYILCGPAPMIDSVEESLEALGVPLSQIVSEKFSYD